MGCMGRSNMQEFHPGDCVCAMSSSVLGDRPGMRTCCNSSYEKVKKESVSMRSNFISPERDFFFRLCSEYEDHVLILIPRFSHLGIRHSHGAQIPLFPHTASATMQSESWPRCSTRYLRSSSSVP